MYAFVSFVRWTVMRKKYVSFHVVVVFFSSSPSLSYFLSFYLKTEKITSYLKTLNANQLDGLQLKWFPTFLQFSSSAAVDSAIFYCSHSSNTCTFAYSICSFVCNAYYACMRCCVVFLLIFFHLGNHFFSVLIYLISA